ncbi:hypothetical protein FKR81_32515 [Lentzea tibetensis]|uniref:Phage-related protein n=1 Tax=Lentzea tibetensis TaxID=2591470 RepID=A0A563EK79_9PSEU|nr:hypothetical protein [Lentzea tibetensis]TWP47436.1 hypothetical protein FKR81_32515 [Lentzea tibetensis]
MPSLQGLGRHVREAINEAERGAPDISLGAQIQTALVRAQLRALAAEGDQTAIQLLAKLDAAPAEREAAALRERLNKHVVRIGVVLDKSFTGSLRGLAQLDHAVTRTTGEITRHTATVGAATLKYAAFAGVLAQAISLTGGLGAAAATASGSLLVLPAVGIAAAAALNTLRLGVDGLSDALKAETTTDYAKAVEKFPPAMRETTDAVRALRPQLDGLQLDVQSRLFAALGGEVTRLGGTYLPVLRHGLADVAGGFNHAAHEVALFAREGRTVDDVRLILDNTGQSVRALSGGAAPLLRALRDIAAVGSDFLPGFASGFADAATSFAEFISHARETGQLREWLSAGLSALSDFFTTLGNVAGIVFTVLQAANTHGAGLLQTLSALTGSVLAFLRSTEGTVALQQFFTGLSAAGAGLLTLLGAIGRAVAADVVPAIGQLGPVVGQAFALLAAGAEPAAKILAALAPLAGVAAHALAALLVPALGAVSGMVAELAPVVGQLVAELVGGALADTIRELTPELIELARAAAPLVVQIGRLLVQAVRTATPALVELLGALVPIAAELGGALLEAIAAVLPLIAQLAGVWTDVLLTAWEAARPVLPVLVEAVRALAEALSTGLAAATPQLVQIGQLLGQTLATALTGLLPLLPPLVEALVRFWAEGLLPMTPLLLQLVAELLPSLIPLLVELLPVVLQAIQIMTVWNAGLLKLAAIFTDHVIPVLRYWLDEVVRPVFRNVVDVVSGALRIVQGVINFALGAITGNWDRAWSGLREAVSGAWSFVRSGVELGVRSLLGFLGGLPGQMLGALGDLGSLLLEAGKNVIRGLLRGIESMIGSVRSKLSELTDLLPDWKGPPTRDAKLLHANGVLIMRSLVDGFESEEPAVRRYLTDLIGRLPALVAPASAVQPDSVVPHRFNPSTSQGVRSTTSEDVAALVDAVRELAARPVVVQVGATEIARATAEGTQVLSRR